MLAERHLHLGAGRFGLLLAAIGIGAGIGPLIVRRAAHNVTRPLFLFGPYLLRGLVDLSLATFASFAGALASQPPGRHAHRVGSTEFFSQWDTG